MINRVFRTSQKEKADFRKETTITHEMEGGSDQGSPGARTEPGSGSNKEITFPNNKDIIRGADIDLVRLQLESTWSTKQNSKTVTKLEEQDKLINEFQEQLDQKEE